EQALHVLGAVLGIPARAAVAGPDVEPSVGAENEVAAVVVGVRLVEEQEQARGRRNRAPAVRAIPDDPRVTVHVRVVDVQEAVRGVARIEGEPEQPLLPSGVREIPDVEEEPAAQLPSFDDADGPALLYDV